LEVGTNGFIIIIFFDSQGAYEGTQYHARVRARTGDLWVSGALTTRRD